MIAIRFARGRDGASLWAREDAEAAAVGDELILDEEATAPLRDQLEEYFNRRRRRFELRLSPSGTPFQQAVWQQVAAIPYGETRSYGEIARAMGRPKASRAVGAANGANPLPIVVPCHRVIGTDGSLTGFGGGLDAKVLLLELEGIRSPGGEQLSMSW
ncbi:MAG: methylated-DNA--[protein]-cysteine S-methyltransferase [Acidobacteriota bacterium]|nr:methylated-DNA--[protein]-cysteine S-methyltransferase [Acidobacteriota bacterium]